MNFNQRSAILYSELAQDEIFWESVIKLGLVKNYKQKGYMHFYLNNFIPNSKNIFIFIF